VVYSTFFRALKLGRLTLPNRVVMAPLTRMRAASGGLATSLMAEYYGQRATAGLIFTEGTAVSPQAHGYPASPGIYTHDQIAAWRAVTDCVHANGGRVFLQLQHNGRGSLPAYNHDGSLPVAPSALPYVGKVYTPSFKPLDPPVPRALELTEIVELVIAFAEAAENALEAGFDGIDIQGANGHLVDQFLCDGSNQRTDGYGGGVEARARFLLEIVDSVSAVIGTDRVGVRLSPFGRYGGISDTNPLTLFSYVLHELSHRQIAYVHLIEARASEIGIADELHPNAPNNTELFREAFSGPLISAGAYTSTSGAAAIDGTKADAIAFGRLFIANADLVDRIRLETALNEPDRSTFYGGDAHGYVDYPALTSNLEANTRG
jgi:N-ethylmaleimide reductase